MADDLIQISDLVADALDLSDAQVTDLAQATPFLNLLPMEESSNGTTHKYSKETGAPVVGFRAENAGRDMDHSIDSIVTVALKILDWSFMADKAVADAWRKGGRNAWIAREGMRNLKQALVEFEQQVIYGTTALGDSAGFTGIINAATVDALADPLVINSGGTTADVQSSVYAVRVGADDLTGVFKGDGPALEVGETSVIQRVVNPGSDNKTFPAYYTPACTWLGLQVGSIHSMGRICNIEDAANDTLTDDKIASLLAAFPVGKSPTHLVMSRRSQRMLQQNRTATNPTGAPAPFPTESHGIPVVVTDNVVDTEAVVS